MLLHAQQDLVMQPNVLHLWCLNGTNSYIVWKIPLLFG